MDFKKNERTKKKRECLNRWHRQDQIFSVIWWPISLPLLRNEHRRRARWHRRRRRPLRRLHRLLCHGNGEHKYCISYRLRQF